MPNKTDLLSTKNRIDFDEFYQYIASDEDIQAFLVEYMGYQTRDHALKRYEAYYQKYLDCFSSAAGLTMLPKEEDKAVSVCINIISLFSTCNSQNSNENR